MALMGTSSPVHAFEESLRLVEEGSGARSEYIPEPDTEQ